MSAHGASWRTLGTWCAGENERTIGPTVGGALLRLSPGGPHDTNQAVRRPDFRRIRHCHSGAVGGYSMGCFDVGLSGTAWCPVDNSVRHAELPALAALPLVVPIRSLYDGCVRQGRSAGQCQRDRKSVV